MLSNGNGGALYCKGIFNIVVRRLAASVRPDVKTEK